MSKNNELFELIASLSKSEKRYVRLLAGMNSGSQRNHMRLFDAIEQQVSDKAQSKYDETLVREALKGMPMLNQLHVAKNYLKELILKGLRMYHANISIYARLKDYLRDIEILYKKGLYEQCLKRINQAEALAEKYEKHGTQIELFDWKRSIAVIKFGSYSGIKQITEIVDKENETVSKIKNITDYWKLSMEIMGDNFRRNTTPRDPGKRELKSKLLADESSAQSYGARKMFHFVNYTNNIFNGNLNEAYFHAKRNIEVIEEQPHQINEDPLSYANAVNNLIPICFRMKKYEEIALLIDRVKKLSGNYRIPKFKNLEYKIYLRTYNHELELYRDLGEIGKGVQLLTEVEKFIRSYRKYISADYLGLFRFQFAFFRFGNSEYRVALNWVNDLLNDAETSRTDIQAYARILNLMIHYELKNYEIIDSLSRSAKRYLDARNRLYEFEIEIIRFFEKACNSVNAEARVHFEELKQRIALLQEDYSEALDFINIHAWINSKLSRTTFEKALKMELNLVQHE